MAKVVLGRGLGSLIQTRPPTGAAASSALHQPSPGERVQQVALDEVVPSPYQPRKDFRPEQLTELVESIRERGIIQPLIVRRVHGQYELIAGERRWRAARQAGLSQVPVILREATDQQVLELALVENLQRADLNVIEEARAYHRLAGEFGLRQEDIAQKVGRSRASVANVMRLLDLDAQVQDWLTQERLTIGHAKVLLAVKAADEQRLLAEAIIRQSLTVRGTEKLVATHLSAPLPASAAAAGTAGTALEPGTGPDAPAAAGAPAHPGLHETAEPARRTGPGSRRPPGEAALSPALRQLENRLRDHLATYVSLRHGGKKGTIEIEYYDLSDLQRILDALGLPTPEEF